MIHFDPASRSFNLLLKHSHYTFAVDRQDRVIHVGWGVRPADADDATLIDGSIEYEYHYSPVGFERQLRPYEVLTYGDISQWHVTLGGEFDQLLTDVQAHEAPNLPLRDIRLRYVSHEIVSDAQPGLAPTHGLPVLNESPRQTLRLRLQDPVQKLTVIACYRITPEHDIIERWFELHNEGTATLALNTCNFASLHLPNSATELTHVTGSWSREFTTERRQIQHGAFTFEGRSVQTGHFSNPFFLLNRPNRAHEKFGTVYFGALAYSGAWHVTVEHLPTYDVRVHAGYNPHDFELILKPGDSHTTPAFVTGVSNKGWGGASRRLHAFTRERLLPRPTGKPAYRPVLYNSWEATYFDLSYEGQALLAQKAADMGVELFCLDDGWFGGRRSDRAGLGDWTVSDGVFPDGMEKLVAEVQRLGMDFGLWVEPEMVNADSDLYREHPDWILHFPSRPRTEARNQLILDFGRKEVTEHIFQLLDDLVDRYSVSFFKWDMNRNASEAGSVVGKAIWRKHTEGVYDIMDRLRRKYPTLDIQSCSGGGGRIDLGVLQRTDQVWTSDNTDAHDRIRIQEGYSLVYPARAMEAWVTHRHNHITQRVTPLDLRFNVAMRGVLGIGSSLNELDEKELKEYASHIAFYKRIRHIVQDGDLYRLQRLEEFGASAIQYVLLDGSEAVYSLAVDTYQIGSRRAHTPLKGLVSNARYTVTDRKSATIHEASGYELMTLGIPKETMGHPGYSRTYHIKQT